MPQPSRRDPPADATEGQFISAARFKKKRFIIDTPVMPIHTREEANEAKSREKVKEKAQFVETIKKNVKTMKVGIQCPDRFLALNWF